MNRRQRSFNNIVKKMLAIVLVTVIFLYSLKYSVYDKYSKATSKFPSGYSSLPFIGETLAFLKPHSIKNRGQFMELRISRFGKVFSSNLFGKKVILSADPELNRFVMKNDRKMFAPAWPHNLNKLVGEKSIFLAVGEAHKHMKSTMVQFLSNEKMRTQYLRNVDNNVLLMMNSWKENAVFPAKKEITKFSLTVLVKEILGMNGENQAAEKLQENFDSLVRGMTSLPLYFPGTLYWEAFKSKRTIDQILLREIEKRKTYMANEICRTHVQDFLGRLISINYSEEGMLDMLRGFLLAGHDDISRAITAMIYFLHGCPLATKQLREEHLQIKSSKKQKADGIITWDDYKGLEFTKWVIYETLRLSNTAIAVPKMAITNVEFKGYLIPRGCDVMLHHKSVHLDPLLYINPDHFNPWRWQSISNIHMSNTFMPFGAGVRQCPGSELAKLEMMVFLHHFILRYDWELVEPDYNHPLSSAVVEFPNGLPIKVRAISS